MQFNGWGIKKLSEVSKITYGYTDSASSKNVGPKFLRITDIQNNNVIWNDVPYCNCSKDELPKYKLEDGDIVFARTGATTGKSFLIKNPPNAVFASYLIRLKIHSKNVLLPEFVALYFQTANYWNIINTGLSGSAQGGFNATKLGELKIPIPSLSEQKRIVEILDEAFAAIDRAKANVEKNLQNAKELFESYLQSVFTSKDKEWEERKLSDIAITFARGKSKHRPRNDKKLYGGKYPFIQTGDVRNASKHIVAYTQTYSEVGLAQSRLWPKGTICITIAANIAETGILDFDSCFPDSMIGLVVDPNKANVNFTYYALQYLKAELQRLGKGSAQDNINLGTFENQYFPFPKEVSKQRIIAEQLDSLFNETKLLRSLYNQKMIVLEELKKSILQKAFAGELNADVIKKQMVKISHTDLQAAIISLALQKHQGKKTASTFGHVKSDKIVNNAQYFLNLDLDRNPIKDAAGPNDFSQLKKVELRAQKAVFFSVNKINGRHEYKIGNQVSVVLEKARSVLGQKWNELEKLIDVFVPMDTQQAEIVATVFSAWNNLLIEKKPITDEAIVYEARENWHKNKLNIERDRFFKAIEWMKQKGLVPKGTGKKVLSK